MSILGLGSRWISNRSWTRTAKVIGFAASMVLVANGPAARGQAVPANAAAAALAQTPPSLPPTPPQGAWGEVIMANRQWMVVQNSHGQQFPIAMDQINQFLIRWPTRLDALGPQTLVEAIGPDQGNNTLMTDHVDTFEGGDRDLVQPTFTSLLPNNRPVTTLDPGFPRFMSPYDIGSQNLLYGWAYPVSPMQGGIPSRLHVVGSVASVNPAFQVVTPGNNWATILSGGALSITRVTRGTTAFAQKGDLVFLMPTGINLRSVVLSQAVLYKKMPIQQFRMP